MASDDVSRRLAEVRWSTEGLLAALREVPRSPGWARQPSLLPGWSRGHVLTHLARNAEGVARSLTGTLRGEPIPMYGGADRDAAIEAGAGRDPDELVEDVAATAARLEATWSRLSPADWARPALHRSGSVPALRMVGLRWREVEVHRVDLDSGYGPGDWPASFVAPLLPSLLDPDRIRPRLPAGLVVEVINTDSGQRWLVGDVTPVAGTARSTRAAAVRSAAPPPVRVVGPSWALVGWLVGRPSAVRRELPDPPALRPWS